MNINVTHPEILRIQYRPEPNDKCYPACMWANFDMDMGTDTLTITSDCGTYSYGYWSVGPGGFLKFLCGLHEDYLLKKLAKEDLFDPDATIDGLREDLEDSEEYSKKRIDSLIKDLRERMETMDEDGKNVYGVIDGWNRAHKLGLIDLWEAPVYDYHPQAKRIVQIFIDHIQPKIREIVKAGGQYV